MSDDAKKIIERNLTRNRIGVDDSVLIVNYTSEDEFMSNLQRRFAEDMIYVCPKYTNI